MSVDVFFHRFHFASKNENSGFPCLFSNFPQYFLSLINVSKSCFQVLSNVCYRKVSKCMV